MKKKITLIVMILMGMVAFMAENTIEAFATQYDMVLPTVGTLFKSGDVINIQKIPGCDENYFSNYGYDRSKCTYVYFGEYYDNYDTKTSFSGEFDEEKWFFESKSNKYNMPKLKNGETAYWKLVDSTEDTSYHFANLSFEKVDYVEPTFNIKCEGPLVDSLSSTKCTINAKYGVDLNLLDFVLRAPNFNVSDFKASDNWKVENSKDNNYKLITTSNKNASVNNLVTSVVATFNLKASSQEALTNYKDNINITNVSYIDKVTSSNIDKVATTLNIKPVDKKTSESNNAIIEDNNLTNEAGETNVEEIPDNPPTGIQNIVKFILLGLACSGILFVYTKKKTIFKKI